MTFADVVRRTAHNFPDPRFHLQRIRERRVSERYVIRNPDQWAISGNSDGIGTKPELAERLFALFPDYGVFKGLGSDVAAMVADDASREGHFVLAIQNNLDVSSADDPQFIAALAQGMLQACDRGQFALLNGETAELGYRVPGYGSHRLNWNAAATVLVNEEKMFHPENLRAGHPVVALRERSIRSNGLTRARAILEQAYLGITGCQTRQECIVRLARQRLAGVFSEEQILRVANATLIGGEPPWEHITLPWHLPFSDIVEKLLRPSSIYTPLTYAAQGGIDGAVRVPIVAAAHISGGGIPLKAGRMLEAAQLGIHLDPVFPDPEGIPELLELARRYPDPDRGQLVNDKTACEQWNRGIGFLCVTEQKKHADDLIALAAGMGYEAAVAGEIIAQRRIEWRGHVWQC